VNPFSRLTIRARITGGSVLIAILISVVAGLVVYNQVQRIVSEGQVRVLEGIAGQYVSAIESGDTEEFDPPGPGQSVAVVAANGSIAINTLPDPLADKALQLASAPDGVRVVGDDEEAYLVKTQTVHTGGDTWHVITADGEEEEVLHEVALLLIASIAVITLGFGAAAWLIGSAALAPVTRLRRSAAELVSASGSELLPVGPARDEIADLAETLNELIEDLRVSAERERQIVSDASHEFRTPLAIIQTRLELAQREATTLADMKSDVASAQRTLTRLSSLATSMLELSRIDAQTQAGRAMVTELATELADAADRGRARVGGRDIRIDYIDDTVPSDQPVAVSEDDFGRVCDNLVNNALAAITAAGMIELHLSIEVDGIRLSVRDDGGGMDEAYVPHAFDRFSRASQSRTQGGAGLGLSIVAGIVSVSGGAVTLANHPGTGLEVIVDFPFSHGHAASSRSEGRTGADRRDGSHR
jgi:two-component system OmpR family sensor kinase